MKRHALCIITLFGMIITGLVYPLALYAQAPQAIAYQAIVRGSDGNVLADQQVSFQITIHKDAADGPEVYCETHTPTTSPLGLVTLEIGNGSLVFGSFEAIDWSTGVYFLEVEIDPEGGTAYVALGTTQLLSVPYALYSEKTGQTYQAGSGIDITDEVITNTAPDQQVSMYNGSGIDVTGTYPDFTITNTSPDQDVFITEGGGIGVTGGYPNFTLTNTAPDQEVVLTDGDGISTTGTYPSFTITNTEPNAYHYGDAEGSDALVVSGIQGRPVSPAEPVMDQVLQWDGSQWNPTTLSGASPGWSLTGNSGTDPEMNFLGTTDNQPLRIKVNNERAGEINPINNNTFLGRMAGANSTANSNVAVGTGALYSNTDRSNLVAVGDGALYHNGLEATEFHHARENTAIGSKTLYSNTIGWNNSAVGFNALYSNETGRNNTASGSHALYSNTHGLNNTGSGNYVLYSNTDGSYNTAFGGDALFANNANSCNTAIGYQAMCNADDREEGQETYNTAVGYQALKGSEVPSDNRGDKNTAIGTQTLYSNNFGDHNTALGFQVLYSNTDGEDNTAVGDRAMYSNTEGSTNVAIGSQALYSITEGDNNTALGPGAGRNSTGDKNVFIGYHAGYYETGSNKLYIANSSIDPPLIYGDFSTGQIGLGTITPMSKIHVVGEDNVRMILSSANGANDLASELMMKGTFSAPIPDQVSRNIAMLKACFDGDDWGGATLGFHVAGNDCITDGDTDPCERMRITSDGQVGIGTEDPHASAILDVASTTMGFLPPRMTASQRTAISSPAAGLLVYQTDAPSGYYYYTGSGWVSIEGTGAGSPSSCIDYDGNAYPTFTIGDQVWMAENLRVTHYRNGDAIPNVTDGGAWAALTTGAYCWYDNNEVENAKFGALYNWFAVDDSRGLCPEGWRVPTNAEWTTFTSFLGGQGVAGGKMKSVSALWNDPNTDATNNSGFSALPGGYRDYGNGSFESLGYYGSFWSSSQSSADEARYWFLGYDYAGVWGSSYYKELGRSVRCLKDE